MKIIVQPYSNDFKLSWDNFIGHADNTCFLFERDFMEYHSNRFADSSVMLFDGDTLVGIFPANRKEDVVYSHQGLTHGGLVLLERKGIKKLIAYFHALFVYYKTQGIKEVVYKPFPDYLSKTTNDVEHFILNMCNAFTVKIDTAFVIDYSSKIKIREGKKYNIKKGIKVGVDVRIDNDFETFWNKILIPNLRDKFGTEPVHSLEEIKLLHQRFPNKIIQANAYLNNEIVAGVTLFDFNNCIHTQYIASNDHGRDSGAIDTLCHHLIQQNQSAKNHFSLGTSNNTGRDINIGLSEWKEGWGANIHAQYHYRLNLENINVLEKFI